MTAPTTSTAPDTYGSGTSVPWVQWPVVHKYVNMNWDPENTPHHSIIGLTGSGKTFLMVHGILKPMCAMDRVVFFDTKGGSDKTLCDAPAIPCSLLPRNTWGGGRLGRQREPFDSWHRIVLSPKRGQAQYQVESTLERIWHEGNYVIAADELRYLTSSRKPFLGMEGPITQLYTMGRSKHISLIAATQAPVWCPSSFFDQASFAWIGRIRDEVRQKRLLEIGGMTKKELPYIASLQRRQWLLAADNGEAFYRSELKI